MLWQDWLGAAGNHLRMTDSKSELWVTWYEVGVLCISKWCVWRVYKNVFTDNRSACCCSHRHSIHTADLVVVINRAFWDTPTSKHSMFICLCSSAHFFLSSCFMDSCLSMHLSFTQVFLSLFCYVTSLLQTFVVVSFPAESHHEVVFSFPYTVHMLTLLLSFN